MSDIIQSALNRYQSYLSAEDFSKLIEVSSQDAPLAIRANLLKNANPQQNLLKWQNKYGWRTDSVPFWQYAVQILQAEIAPSQTIEHQFGYYYIQDAASTLPVALFDPIDKNHLVLDMAASPGGKTTQLIDRSLDRAFIIANDSSASRLSALRVVIQNWGMANGMISNYAAEKIGDWFPNTFDRILLDAPCSMESLRVSKSHPYRYISISERERLYSRQLELLISALKACKVGGEIVYSTCTMAPEENESVINALLTRYPNVVTISRIENQNPNSQGLSHFEEQIYHPDIRHALRVWPHLYATNGFFACKLQKTDEIETAGICPPKRAFSQTGLSFLKSDDLNFVLEELNIRFGFESKLLEDFEIYQRDNQLFIIPKAYLEHFPTLPFNALGLPLGKRIKTAFEPSFEFVMRFGMTFQRNVWHIPADLQIPWLQGRDLHSVNLSPNCSYGIVAVKTEDNILIGAGKWSAQRLRNLLPHRYLIH